MSIRFRNTLFVVAASLSLGQFASAAPPTPPDGMFIKAEKTDTEFQLKVTWKDFSDEDRYALFRTESASAGPILDANNPPPEWTQLPFLSADTTQFLDNDAVFAEAYGICALKDTVDS